MPAPDQRARKPGSAPLTTEPTPRALPPARAFSEDHRRAIADGAADGSLRKVRRSTYVPRHEIESAGGAREADVLDQMRGVAERLTTRWWFSHTSAALVWGCWTWHLRPEVHVTQLTNPQVDSSDPFLIRHWSKRLPERDRSEVDGVPVTSLERTVVDCARLLREPQALVIADSALRLGAERELIRRILSDSAGARGIRRARQVLSLADPRSESPGETLVRWIAHFYDLPPLSPSVPVRTASGEFFIDLGWPELKVGIEFDGAVKYSGGDYGDPAERLLAQERRERALRAAGWLIIRVTWDELDAGHLLALRLQKAHHEARTRTRR